MGKVILRGHKLAFKGVADILVGEGVVHGALWAITPTCEASLDHYEGYPKLYDKKLITITREGYGELEALTYVLCRDMPVQPPGRTYLNEIMQGYRDCGIPMDQLQNAVRDAAKVYLDEIEQIRRAETGLLTRVGGKDEQL
jgi:gamma-glutamylcyclotransferase (GGCT)/AIG2-like uncharacterized protein YtfP